MDLDHDIFGYELAQTIEALNRLRAEIEHISQNLENLRQRYNDDIRLRNEHVQLRNEEHRNMVIRNDVELAHDVQPIQSVASTSNWAPSAPKRKWYVVFQGRIPGVYSTWPECNEQVRGFSNCLFQAYDNRATAERVYHQYCDGQRR